MTRRERWEHAAEWPLTGAAVLFLAAYAWPILDPAPAPPWPTVARVVTWGTWVLFVVDYEVRLGLSEDRRRFVRRNLLDLAVIALPLLRPLRLLRLVMLFSVLNRYAGGSLRGRVAVYVVGSTVLVLFVASLAVLDAERGADGGNIASFDDALWWALTTVTTDGVTSFRTVGSGVSTLLWLTIGGSLLRLLPASDSRVCYVVAADCRTPQCIRQ